MNGSIAPQLAPGLNEIVKSGKVTPASDQKQKVTIDGVDGSVRTRSSGGSTSIVFLGDPEAGTTVGQTGPDRAAMAARFPELVWPPEMGDGPWWDRPFEAVEERLPRAGGVLAELLARHAPGPDGESGQDGVAIFTHANFYNYILAALLGFTERRPQVWFSLLNTGITRIDFFTDREPFIAYQNRVEHLPPELVTG